jgi:hypothetical protein
MDVSKKYCQNCNNELDDGSTVCKRCNVIAALNLENFLLSRFKLLTVIGIFGALSVYLSTTASTQGGNGFLEYGSYISLAIVILLSIIWGWELVKYSFKILEFPFDGEDHYRIWFKIGFRFSTIILFLSFFTSVILLISAYILTNVTIAEPLMNLIVLAFILIFLISTIYYPYRSMIEKSGNVARYFMIIILIIIFVFTMQYFSTDTTSKWPYLVVEFLFGIVILGLIIRSFFLVYQDMKTGIWSFTIDKFKKKLRYLWKRYKK